MTGTKTLTSLLLYRNWPSLQQRLSFAGLYAREGEEHGRSSWYIHYGKLRDIVSDCFLLLMGRRVR